MKAKISVFVFFLLIFSQIWAQKTPFSIGLVDSLYSEELHEKRTLNIYLPADYSPDSANIYSVIYLLDGSADEDFIHIAGLVQFANFPWINLLPKSIVVGIANVDRKRDFTFPTSIEKDKKDYPTTGGSEKFISFIKKELQPYIQKNYRANSSKMLIGQSLGGLLATEILFKQPDLFNQYIIVSPSLWWDNESLMKISSKVLQGAYNQPISVFIAVGKEGKIMERDAKNLYRTLKNTHTSTMKIGFKYLAGNNHANILHLSVYHAFEWLSKKP